MGGGGVTRYTVTLDAEQLELVGLALGYLRAEVEAGTAALRPEHRELVASRTAETLGALKTTRKPVRTPKPRAAVEAEPIEIADAALADFMRRSRERGAPTAPLPIPAPKPFPRKVGGPTALKLDLSARTQTEEQWANAVALAECEPGSWLRRLAGAPRAGVDTRMWGLQ